MINSWCAELCKTITALKTCWVKEISKPDVSDLAKRHDGTKSGTSKIQDMGDNGSEFSLPTLTLTPATLGSILTYHLINSCSSIVVSADNAAINQVR